MIPTHRVLVEKLVENNHLKDLGLNGKIILKRIFNKLASYFERSYEPSGFIKRGEILR
jgi:hypothetical protein